jgi:adenine-specific DNA methylase
LASCRAVILAALLPDPAAPECPESFRAAARERITAFAQAVPKDKALAEALGEQAQEWIALSQGISKVERWDPRGLRSLLLRFIADAAICEMATESAMLECARGLVEAAHVALGGQPGTKPLVVDPFAGGGAIPLEALRVGADAFAMDCNPVAVLLLKTVLEYIPRYGTRLADAVEEWGAWVEERAQEELAQFYPTDPDGSVPIAYLWARTVRCESPAGCNADMPLIHQLGLARRGKRSIALRMMPDKKAKRVDFEIVAGISSSDVQPGTVRRGAATCPICGYTTPANGVRVQLRERRGGARDARMLAVATTHSGSTGRRYRLPTDVDLRAVSAAAAELERHEHAYSGRLSLVPDEPYPGETAAGAISSSVLYGIKTWGDLFTPRQALALTTLAEAVTAAAEAVEHRTNDVAFSRALRALLACALDRAADHYSSLCAWNPSAEKLQHTFTRQALPLVWDFCEAQPFGRSVGDWSSIIDNVLVPFQVATTASAAGRAEQGDATSCPLPDDAAQALITDPPYYDAIAYADLSDFFYVWLKRTMWDSHEPLVAARLTPKEAEIVSLSRRYRGAYGYKTDQFFYTGMAKAFADGRRVLAPGGVGVVVFAHKSTAGWEAMLQAIIDAGWTITASWPIDTELATRVRAMGTASLASSVHLACRARENPDGSVSNTIGDWRQVLTELGPRVHEWMPRLAKEGVVGADAIFACLGPALEIFSRYSRVETAGGEIIPLADVCNGSGDVVQRGYLSFVWETVAREALNMIFEGADASGFEEDARLTALWLWTLRTEANGIISANGKLLEDEEPAESEDAESRKVPSGFGLRYDAARKISQGLGVHLEELDRSGGIVEIKGETARLLAVAERRKWLLGGEEKPEARRWRERQQVLFEEMAASQDGPLPEPGATVLDRLHQAMLLFGDGRGETLRFFLTQGIAGRDQRFWRLAQALSALYPMQCEEKRWVDGVLSRKKALGL